MSWQFPIRLAIRETQVLFPQQQPLHLRNPCNLVTLAFLTPNMRDAGGLPLASLAAAQIIRYISVRKTSLSELGCQKKYPAPKAPCSEDPIPHVPTFTLQVKISLSHKTHVLAAFIDSGSAGNFMEHTTTAKLQLPLVHLNNPLTNQQPSTGDPLDVVSFSNVHKHWVL